MLAAGANGIGIGTAAAQQRCEPEPAPRSAPTVRFDIHADGTVTDKESKLMWTRCSAGQVVAGGSCSGEVARMGWLAAQGHADEVNRRGDFFYSDWRLPKLAELATIAERRCADPRINLAVFPATPALPYWTVTSRPGTTDTSFAYALSFGDGGLAYAAKEEANAVRLVRGAR